MVSAKLFRNGHQADNRETYPFDTRMRKREPRVLMFVPQFPYPVVGGLERQSLELSTALLEIGVSVSVVSGKISPDQPDHESVEGILVTRIPWGNSKLWRFLRAPIDISRVFWSKRRDIDIVHLHQNSWASLFALLAAKLIGKPVLMKLPNVGDYGIPGIRRRFLGGLQVSILRLASGIIAMSNESKAELLAIGFPEQRILTVPNGIALRERRERVHRDPKRECRVVFVGRLSEEKCLDSLLGAWRKVVSATEQAPCLELWGDGPLREALLRQCEKTDLLDSVSFAGHVKDVRDRLSAVDIFVLPSRVEGNSNAVLEAMEAGLPIVATRVGGTPMQVGGEGEHLLFDAGDGDGLAERLLTLLRNEPERLRAGKAMRRRIEVFFDIRNVARMYLRAYRCLLDENRMALAECGRLPD